MMNLDDFAERTGIELPDGPYETVAGFLLSALGHLPKTGESAEIDGSRLTVSELDGRRIARVQVSRAVPKTLQPGTGQPRPPGQPQSPGQPQPPGQSPQPQPTDQPRAAGAGQPAK